MLLVVKSNSCLWNFLWNLRYLVTVPLMILGTLTVCWVMKWANQLLHDSKIRVKVWWIYFHTLKYGSGERKGEGSIVIQFPLDVNPTKVDNIWSWIIGLPPLYLCPSSSLFFSSIFFDHFNLTCCLFFLSNMKMSNFKAFCYDFITPHFDNL